MRYSIIIPVYNRPEEVRELLLSLQDQTFKDFEVLIVEDGSDIPCREIVERFSGSLNIRYFLKENQGPGPARNYGASEANGQTLIFLDSDCVLPPTYMECVSEELNKSDAGAFGGPDRAHSGFTDLQKAISFAMTSFLTTGGIRGGKQKLDRFHPRSFNMGIRRSVFDEVGGFSTMRFGEDIDLSLRILEQGFQTRLFPSAWVWHKRRTDLRKFFRQVFNSGCARIVLTRKHPGSLKIVHLLPSLFLLGVVFLLILTPVWPWAITPIIAYAIALFLSALLLEHSIRVAILAIPASFIQLAGYGSGFLTALWKVTVRKDEHPFSFVGNFYK